MKTKNLLLNLEIDDAVPEKIESDPKRIRQIIFNLIGNALKFTFKGEINVRLQFVDGNIISEVQDTGIGIK